MQRLHDFVFAALALGVVIGYGALVAAGMKPEGALAFMFVGGLIVGVVARVTIQMVSGNTAGAAEAPVFDRTAADASPPAGPPSLPARAERR